MIPGWWAVDGSISVCDSNVTGLIYIIREDGVYRVSSDSAIQDKLRIDQDLTLIKLFRFQNHLYALTIEGGVYQLINESASNKWKYRRVTEIYKKDLSSSCVEDIYPCNDGTISLKISGVTHTYIHDQKIWLEEPDSPEKIVYGETSETKLILHRHHIDFHFVIVEGETISVTGTNDPVSAAKNNIPVVFSVNGCFKDGEISLAEDGILVVDSKGLIREYRPIVWIPIVDNRQHHFREKIIQGVGDRLLRTKNNIWLLTGAGCSRV